MFLLNKTIQYPTAELPDYAKYINENRIKKILGHQKSIAFAVGGKKYYANGELKTVDDILVSIDDYGLVKIDPQKASVIFEKKLLGTTPEALACEVGMCVTVYENKVILFFEGPEPLNAYDDMYTYESMYQHIMDEDREEISNSFIDLPKFVSNETNNTVFYTAPDLNLGVQTSVYFAQMGQKNGVVLGPSIVAGEGQNSENYTTVRVFNPQQVCTTQFLAFDPSVKGGVQVAAAQVGEKTVIATAPFEMHEGQNGDIRVFDTFGMIRMEINVRSIVPAPHTIITGHFIHDISDEVLLVASQKTNENGELLYALISLADGSVISHHSVDFSFDCNANMAKTNVQWSVRCGAGKADSVILHCPDNQTLYEGDVWTGEFERIHITLPDNTVKVDASHSGNQKYILSLSECPKRKNQSFVGIFDDKSTECHLLDVGFRENRFFYNADHATTDNDDLYVSSCRYNHLRADFTNHVFAKINACQNAEDIFQLFKTAKWSDFEYSNMMAYMDVMATRHFMAEPCFTHRWNRRQETLKLSACIDASTGRPRYLAAGKADEYKDYLEMDSAYYNATYADGILEMAKLRILPLRSFLQQAAAVWRSEGGKTERMLGVSPVHEQEINVPESVGDYNPYMIHGFRAYLLKRYHTVAEINQLFGTPFTSVESIDAPRDSNRGLWDAYVGEYFIEWVKYNRYIVSKRMMEAYREALLAGYAPETISAHQIPEGEAVAGFLGEADTRLTPIDVVLTCGTAYGGTRYGGLCETNNLIYNAHLIGHSSMTLGEYGSLFTSADDAYKQIKMLWNNGLRIVKNIPFNDQMRAAENEAIQRLTKENQPRPGYTGGTAGVIGVSTGTKQYQIVHIGEGPNSKKAGLLKSVADDGSWEGTVYVVPFHSQIETTELQLLPLEGKCNTFTTGVLGTLKNSDQVEITFIAAALEQTDADVRIEVYNRNCLLKDSSIVYNLTSTMTPYRYVLSNQLYDDNLEIRITFHSSGNDEPMQQISINKLCGTVQREKVGFSYYHGSELAGLCKAHEGGVTFDVIDRHMKK